MSGKIVFNQATSTAGAGIAPAATLGDAGAARRRPHCPHHIGGRQGLEPEMPSIASSSTPGSVRFHPRGRGAGARAVSLRTPYERQLLSSHNSHTVLNEAHHVHFPLAIIRCRCAAVVGFRTPTYRS